MAFSELAFFWLKCLYLLLPAYFANMAPVVCKKIPFLAKPIDNGIMIKGKALFGKNKTWRGLFFGVLFSILIAYVQYLFTPASSSLLFFGYGNLIWLKLGFLFGFGAIIGDLFESFVKRRLDYSPGKPFVPFDQTDFIMGAMLFGYMFIPSWSVVLAVIIQSFLLHIIVNHIAFYTGIRKEKW